MLNRNTVLVFLAVGLISFFSGCTAPGSNTSTPKISEGTDKKPVVGGIAVGISPRVIYVEKGENVSFTVDLLSTENADDRVTISINDTWINKTLMQDIKAGESASVPVSITVPQDAQNTSIKVKAVSQNLNAISSTTGVILIKKVNEK